ncbi:uncharacterized protein LOC125493558 [Beta vulgaris subsp. vulgaris]|uniref:uncharacterized protein LOC125493558 n=1 Tax=Beta vulgaris subsp. vulgaris TaxID=3555 RepID=UPI0020373EEE|nr:uncharacterized protein LOC125493558 [Beta vulgaris subsp. vulgaris]
MFIHLYVAGKRQKKTSLHLMGVRQEKNESLADYIKKFNEESLKVSDLQDAVAFATLMSGLQPCRLKWSLSESEVKTFSEAMTKAHGFFPAIDICRHLDDGSKKRKGEGNHKDHPRQQKTGDWSDRFSDHGHDPRFSKNRREIYLDIKDKSMLPLPTPIRTSAYRRDKNHWCEYHRECDHTTKDCRELKKGLDNLADQGKLNRYLKHTNEEKDQQKVVFAYEASEMPGLDPKIMWHELNIKEGFKRVKQKLRHQGPERSATAAVEVKLLEAGFIKEFQY